MPNHKLCLHAVGNSPRRWSFRTSGPMDKSNGRFIGEECNFISRLPRSFVHSVLGESKRLAKHEKESQLIVCNGVVKMTKKTHGPARGLDFFQIGRISPSAGRLPGLGPCLSGLD